MRIRNERRGRVARVQREENPNIVRGREAIAVTKGLHKRLRNGATVLATDGREVIQDRRLTHLWTAKNFRAAH